MQLVKNKVTVTCCAAWLLFEAGNFKATALTNIVVNGSFEDGQPPWIGSVTSLELTGGYAIFNGTFGQDVITVPGRDYLVRFGVKYSMPRLHWGDHIYTSFTNIPASSTWQHVYCFARATSAVTRLMFESVSGNVGLDNVVVGWVGDPTRIIGQPQSRSTVEGGSISFTVQADGVPPIYYQWFFDGGPIQDATNHYVIKHEVNASDSGAYHVIVSGAVNAVTSMVATLTVDSSPKEPQIVLHPESQRLPAGYGYPLRTAAIGSLPLSYQWFFNGSELSAATNAALWFVSDSTNAGTYTVRVSNHHGSALSLPANVSVYTLTNPGGYVKVDTWRPPYPAFTPALLPHCCAPSDR